MLGFCFSRYLSLALPFGGTRCNGFVSQRLTGCSFSKSERVFRILFSLLLPVLPCCSTFLYCLLLLVTNRPPLQLLANEAFESGVMDELTFLGAIAITIILALCCYALGLLWNSLQSGIGTATGPSVATGLKVAEA